MAGGTWQSQSKVRPGAYLNFVSIPRPMMTVGDRGIGIIPMSLSWGDTDGLIEVLSTDMLTGASLASVGFTAFDVESKMLNLMLQNCYKALVFRTNANGTKAAGDLGDLTVTARYPGTLGNKIQVSIVALDETRFQVRTYLDARLMDTQIVTEIAELVANDFVTFSGTGDLEEHAGEPLAGGTNGTEPAATVWMPDFLDMASIARWQTMAVPYEDATISKNILTFINDQRNNQGRYVQAVVPNYAADHEGIINVTNNADPIDGIAISLTETTAWVAGSTAGASITTSLTGRVVIGATGIRGELTDDKIKQALVNGEFVFSRNQDGDIKVERDINSFTSFTPDKNYAFSKNRILRTLDEIGTTVKATWERSYMGKVNNDENGRAAFRGDVIAYLSELQRIGAIQEFAGADHVEVIQGDKLDAVLANLRVKPVDSMEFLYMTVNIAA